MKLSLCIPAYNEEKNIHYPLDSAYDLADEVIIIDPGSTDKTVEIAKSYGKKIKVFQIENQRNFLISKQKAIEKASGEWILQLDADEALSEELKNEIKSVIISQNQLNQPESVKSVKISKKEKNTDSTDSTIIGYWIPRKNWFLTKFLMKGGVYPDYVLRLYKKNKANFKLDDIHENVQIKGKIDYLKNPILHYADPDFSRYLLRWDRYTTFDAQDLFTKYKTNKSKWLELKLFINYFFIKPIFWFLKTFFRHKGFIDGFPGFVFSLFSSIRFWAIYVKYYSYKYKNKNI